LAETTLEGHVLRVLFRNAESLYTVARLQTPEGEVTATGPFLEITEGDKFALTGDWTRHAKYGRQFAATEARKVLPDTAPGIEAYLAGGLFKGIGKKLARRLVAHFGDATLDVLLTRPDRVREVPGIGPAKVRSLSASLGEYGKVQSLALFLQGHGVSLSLTMKIHRRYGEDAIALVKANPYRLAAEVEGIGFLTADEIARKLGTDPGAPERVRAAVLHVLTERGEAEGHVCLPLPELTARALEFLNRGQPGPVVRAPQVQEAMLRLAADGWLVRDEGDLIYRRELYAAEAELAERMLALLARSGAAGDAQADVDELIDRVAIQLDVEYAPEQRAAIKTALGAPLAVITGGPGTGKSTVLLGVLTALRMQREDTAILLAAPTGRAARRMSDVTGDPAKTIHRLLGYNPMENGFAYDEANPLEGDVLVVDEFSMVDLNLAAALFEAVPPEMRVLLVGDSDQLPSVGMGNILADLIGSGAVPVVRLTRIYRQAAESRIVLNAHRINAGQMPDLTPAPDCEFVRREEPEAIAQYIRDRALAALDGGATLEQITVLTPMRKTETGVEALNKLLQEALNPAVRGRPELAAGLVTFRLGDKVMQRKNNYEKEVFNGSIGHVTAVDPEEGELAVIFEEGEPITYSREELDQLALAYACTVHKSQGSEYTGLVMIPVTMQHYAMLQRNLLYTALTRAKQKAVLVGTEQALRRAVQNNRITRRHTRLAARLRGEVGRVDGGAAVYVAAHERQDGATGWAALRVMKDGRRQEWSGAQAGVPAGRLLATALGLALHDLPPDVPVVLCTAEPGLLTLLEGDEAAPAEVLMLREILGQRIWRGVTVEPEDPALRECLQLALKAVPADTAEAAAKRATLLGTLGERSGLPELCELLKHGSPKVRQCALRAIGKISPDKRLLEPLNDLLMKEAKEYNRAAAEALLRQLLKG
jgi:exodeoxyribonuclease V alpha subunit